MKFNLEKHLKKNKIFGIGMGYQNIPKEINNLLNNGFVENKNIIEIVSQLYLENIELIEKLKSLETNLENFKSLSGTNIFTEIFVKYKDTEYKIKRITNAIKKIERFRL